VARALAVRLGGVVVSKDEIRAAAFGPLVDYSAAQDDFCMELVYQTVRYLHETRPDVPVIIDGRTYARRAQVERLFEVLPEAPRVIECVCDDEIARERLENDAEHPAKNRNYEMYLVVKAAAERLEIPRLTIDTGTMDLGELMDNSLPLDLGALEID
jgi:predicted kinase